MLLIPLRLLPGLFRLLWTRGLHVPRADGTLEPAGAGVRAVIAWQLLWQAAFPLAALLYWLLDAVRAVVVPGQSVLLAAVVCSVCAAVAVFALPWVGMIVAAKTAPWLASVLGVRWPPPAVGTASPGPGAGLPQRTPPA